MLGVIGQPLSVTNHYADLAAESLRREMCASVVMGSYNVVIDPNMPLADVAIDTAHQLQSRLRPEIRVALQTYRSNQANRLLENYPRLQIIPKPRIEFYRAMIEDCERLIVLWDDICNDIALDEIVEDALRHETVVSIISDDGSVFHEPQMKMQEEQRQKEWEAWLKSNNVVDLLDFHRCKKEGK